MSPQTEIAIGERATAAVEAMAEALCFLDSHRHTVEYQACPASRRRADSLLVALDAGRAHGTLRGETVARWLGRHIRAAEGAAAPAYRDRIAASVLNDLNLVINQLRDNGYHDWPAILERVAAALLAAPAPPAVRVEPDDQIDADLRTLRRNLPAIVGPGTAELWLAYGRIERTLGHGIYAAAPREPVDPEPGAREPRR